MQTLLYVLTALLALLTVLPWFKARAWWVRVWDFPRAQLAVLLALALLGQGLVLDFSRPPAWLAAGAALACLLYQCWWILPYTRLWRSEVRWADAGDDGPRLRMLAANVLMTNRHADALLEQVRQYRPDVLVTLETDAWWQAQLAPLEVDYPYRIACPLDNLYGMHVYSRLPLHEARIEYLVEPDIPSMHASLQLRENLRVRLHFLHPAPPSPTENDESTERDVELLMVAKSLESETGPVVVAGDLNDVAWSPTTRLFRRISGLLDPRVGRGMVNSFHARYWFARWPLDHFFHSDDFELVRIARLPAMGSDHFPVLIELQYHPSNAAQQQGLQADAADRAEARELLAEEGASAGDVPEPTASV
ncbi:endonuclease [Corticibacter populi]|uniref:Endonuclease n=1 Tax=Corticibacter populi TaxID=1550736 RepID=A0A3M6QZG4_9BURK|nr:endonuclease/exonuclease/phosphatase family protein [Corticibacter populi]RMX08424.1 endonuclease [Corticibacter populi]RZS35730.1 endonuclease/exonuclease/phosphatase (EEP) superfamily protein YafD [Corticibacter populi]